MTRTLSSQQNKLQSQRRSNTKPRDRSQSELHQPEPELKPQPQPELEQSKPESEPELEPEPEPAPEPEPEPEPAEEAVPPELDAWLASSILSKYSTQIKEYGYDEMEVLLAATEADIIEMTEDPDVKMKKPHRRAFINKWKELLAAGQQQQAAASPPASPQAEPEPAPAAGGQDDAAAQFAARCVAFEDSGADLVGPVKGLFDDEKNPRVSIEKAVEALPFDLSSDLWVMKKFLKAKDTKAAIAACPDLTVDGAAAIYLFTCESPLYQLNEKLRARNRAELKVRTRSLQS